MADVRSQIEQLITQVTALRKKHKDKRKVVIDLKDLEAKLTALLGQIPPGDTPASDVSLEVASRGGAQDATADDPSESDAMGLADFFENVSQSLIDAQSTLNDRSLEYARNISPGIPPAYYSIPSLKAAMKVGFSHTQGKGVNLILFSKKSQRQEYGESTVEFELVSSPPPPGSQVVLVPKFFVLGAEKKRVLQAIRDNESVKTAAIEISDQASLVLQYRTPLFQKEVKYLAVCPRPLSSSQKLRQGLSAFSVVDSQGVFSLDSGIFTSGNFVQLSPFGERKTLVSAPDGVLQLVRLVENLGDVLLNLILIGHDWLADVTMAIPRFIVTGDDRDLVLTAASAMMGDQLRKGLEPWRDWAVVLRMAGSSDGKPRYLVVWPAEGRQDIVRWSQIAVLAFTRTGDNLKADWQALMPRAKPKEGFVWIQDTATLKSTKPEDLNSLAQQSGDAVLQVVFAVKGWLEQVQRAGAAQAKD